MIIMVRTSFQDQPYSAYKSSVIGSEEFATECYHENWQKTAVTLIRNHKLCFSIARSRSNRLLHIYHTGLRKANICTAILYDHKDMAMFILSCNEDIAVLFIAVS